MKPLFSFLFFSTSFLLPFRLFSTLEMTPILDTQLTLAQSQNPQEKLPHEQLPQEKSPNGRLPNGRLPNGRLQEPLRGNLPLWQRNLVTSFLNRLKIEPEEKLLYITDKGEFASELAHRVPLGRVLTISSDNSSLQAAYTRALSEGESHLSSQELDIEQEELPPSSFDRVLLFFYPSHFANDERVITSIYNCLKPHGRLNLLFLAKEESTSVLNKIFQQTALDSKWNDEALPSRAMQSHCYGEAIENQWREGLQKRGFQIEHFGSHELHAVFKGRQEFYHWISDIYPFTWPFNWPFQTKRALEQRSVDQNHPKKLLTTAQNRFINQVIDNYLAQVPATADGAIHLIVHILEIDALKP